MPGADGQIPLDLAPKPDFSFDTFEVGLFNQAAFSLISSWPDWPSPILALIGPAGVGKTHLGQAWVSRHAGRAMLGADCNLIEDFDPNMVLFLDQAEQATETELFTLLNLALNGQIAGLLLASRQRPKDWSIELPDLQSRLKNVPVADLDEHDDEVLESIVRKLFEDCGRSVNRDVVAYLLAHDDRSVASLRKRVQDLDFAARQAKKDVTRHFVAQILKSEALKTE